MIRTYTGYFLFIMMFFWGGWDIYAWVNDTNATISVYITDFSMYSPMLPFVFGVLIGHWLWPAKGSKD